VFRVTRAPDLVAPDAFQTPYNGGRLHIETETYRGKAPHNALVLSHSNNLLLHDQKDKISSIQSGVTSIQSVVNNRMGIMETVIRDSTRNLETTVNDRMTAMENSVQDLKVKIVDGTENHPSLQQSVHKLETESESLRSDVDGIKSDITEIKDMLTELTELIKMQLTPKAGRA
jgi:chromosome segregation ATPase